MSINDNETEKIICYGYNEQVLSGWIIRWNGINNIRIIILDKAPNSDQNYRLLLTLELSTSLCIFNFFKFSC